MKKPPESRTRTDDLPSFLDEAGSLPTTAQEDALPSAASTAPAADNPAVATEEPPTPAAAPAWELPPPAAEAPAPETPTARRPAANRRAPASGPRSGGLPIAAGLAAMLFAVVLAAVPGVQSFVEPLARFGVQPANLLLLGAVLVGTGVLRCHLSSLQASLQEVHGHRTTGTEALQEGIQFLVAAQQANGERSPATGGELDQVFLTLQRQDDKINNLTKAIKMYGKPLMEISGQSAELAAAIQQVRTALETGNESSRQATARLEGQLRTGPASKQDIAEVQESLFSLAAAVETAGRKPSEALSLEPLQQQLTRIDVAVQALAQRLEDNEVRRSLLRLEDSAQKSRDEMQQLLRGEPVERATAQLQKQLDSATTRLTEGLGQLRDGNLGGIESAVRDIQREVAGVATTVAQIQAAVKAGAVRATPPTPAAPTATAPVAPAAPAAAPSTPSAPPAPPTAGEATAGAAAYQTGTRSTNGKNVLGAIAKLKQMKT